MIISGSNLQLSSSHAYLEYQRREESLTAWKDTKDDRQQLKLTSSSEQLRMGASSDWLTLSQEASESLPELFSGLTSTSNTPSPRVDATAAAKPADATVENVGELRMTMLRLLVEQFTGRSIQVFSADELTSPDTTTTPPELAAAAEEQQASRSRGNGRVGWGVRYHAEEVHQESETTQFTAKGIVRTADGKEIELNLELNMSRAYASRSSLTVEAGDAKLRDPLVINFNGNAAQLTQTTFKFDLDADGQSDDMRFVAPGSGFLALDHNGDGKINNGRELFGAQSGNGFADLAQHDEDGNGWIDEKDAIFSHLRVWTRDESGKEQLIGLLKLGVGALYLGNTDTPFALKDNHNALQGAIRSSGIYLREDGGMGTLQQIDIAV